MNTILISIISDQTIPNLLIIKELSGKYDAQVFITTDKMESLGKSKWIEHAAEIAPGSIPRIIVDENNWSHISKQLDNFVWPKDSGFVVNLTGGTKVMTLAIYSYFSKLGNQIIYSPIGKNNYEELFPDPTAGSLPINYRLSLSEYLGVHGLYYKCDDTFLYPEAHTFRFFETFKSKRFHFRLQPEIVYAHQYIDAKDKQYYSGRWFEEFTLHFLKMGLGISDNQIALNVRLFRNPNTDQYDNEYDVVFTRDNALYVIECKASAGGLTTIKDNFDKYLYKLAAITRDFGLRVNSSVFTLTNTKSFSEGKIAERIARRKEILGISYIFDANNFRDTNQIINQIIK